MLDVTTFGLVLREKAVDHLGRHERGIEKTIQNLKTGKKEMIEAGQAWRQV